MQYAPSEFNHDTPPRIMGSETEYTSGGLDRHEGTAKEQFCAAAVRSLKGTRDRYYDTWLPNGGKLYLEESDVIEYATPECLSAGQVMTHELAGEYAATRTMDDFLRSQQETGSTHPLYKRTGYAMVKRGDSAVLAPMSMGHHENYYWPASTSDNTLKLLSYLATRIVWSGTGMVDTRYQISQRADAVVFNDSYITQHGRKVSHYRNKDTHEPDSPTMRFEVRTGEGNMSQWAIKQKYAMTSLVMRLLEHRQFPESPLLKPKQLTDLMRSTSRTPFDAAHRLGMSALSHQKKIALAAVEFAITQPSLPPEELDAALEVLNVCTELEQAGSLNEDLSTVADRVDWAAKLMYMKSQGLEMRDIHSSNMTAVMYDLKWEDICRNGISRKWYRDKQPLVSEKDVRFALKTPPMTRALQRTRLITPSEHFRPDKIDWHEITYFSNEGKGMANTVQDKVLPAGTATLRVIKLPSPYLDDTLAAEGQMLY